MIAWISIEGRMPTERRSSAAAARRAAWARCQSRLGKPMPVENQTSSAAARFAARAVKGVSDFYDGVGSFQDGLPASVRRLWPQKGVDHAVVFSVATKQSQVDSIDRFIASVVDGGDGFFTGLGTVHQDVPDMGQVVDSIISLGLKGVKMHPDTQGCALDDSRLFPLYEACTGRIPVLLHTGDKRYDFSNPDRMERVLKMFPRTTFIGAHYGGWSVWDEATRRLHGYDNFFVDSSSTFFASFSPISPKARAFHPSKSLISMGSVRSVSSGTSVVISEASATLMSTSRVSLL